MTSRLEQPAQTASRPSSPRRLVWLATSLLILAVLIFAASRSGVFGALFSKSVRAVQSVSNQQSLTIPGMPVCAPNSGPTTTAAFAEAVGVPPNPSLTPTSNAVFGLAWFHKPPEDGATAAQLASIHRYIHLTGPSDIPFRNELRAAGYKGPIFTYVTMNSVEGPGPYRDASASCDASYTPYDNNVAFNKGDFCANVHKNESWFLHNGKGERIVDDYFGTGRWSYMMNPGDPGWRAFAYSRLKYIKDTWSYDGLWLDNLDLDLSRSASELKNSDGTVQGYANDDQWREAVKGWLSGLRAQVGQGYPIWANLVGGGLSATSWDPYAPYLDGAMDESFAVRWLDEWRTPEQWQGQLQRAQRWLNMGKGIVMVGQGREDDTARLRFTLASYLLVASGDNASFRYTRFDSYYGKLNLYPEYDTARALGTPMTLCQEISPGVWRRDFTGGYVQVNVGEHTGQLVLQP